MRVSYCRLSLLAAALLLVALPHSAVAVPKADHVRLQLSALRMNVNDYSIRKQIRVDVELSAEDENRLGQIEESRLTVINPSGVSARVRPYKIIRQPKRFKSGHAEVIFKLVEDSASKPGSNVPRGFFSADGPYRVRVDMRWESYRGKVSFGVPVAARMTQDGYPLRDFVLNSQAPLELVTTPQTFGPVYYKRQDATNFLYQLAGMDDALQRGDFHAPVESPQYFFQLRVGRIGDPTTKLLDPSAYIPGAQHHMIRSDSAVSPIVLPAGGFSDGQTLLLDFSRIDTAPPNSVFESSNPNFSDQVVVQERVLYALEVRPPGERAGPQTAAAAAAEAAGETP
jgi:hypothetical protein